MIEIFEVGSARFSKLRAHDELRAAKLARPAVAKAAHLELAARHLEAVRRGGHAKSASDGPNFPPFSDAFAVDHEPVFDDLLAAISGAAQRS